MKNNIRMIPIVIGLAVITLAASLTACQSHIASSVKNETTPPLPLTEKDFLLSDGKHVLELGLTFDSFTSPEQEKGNHYVGQSYNGDQPYDVYVHYYKDFDIYISDLGKGEVPPYTAPIVISQISTRTAAYKSNRGISIGSNKTDILNVYGEGAESQMDDDDTRTFLEYSLGDKLLSFALDNQNIVQEVMISFQ